MLSRYVSRCFPVLLAFILAAPLAWSQAAPSVDLDAPDGTTVSIERDEFGVPRITAETEAAAFYGQGYAVAQDRLFQMETIWRVATGRTAELAGPGTNNQFIQQDIAIRTVFYTPAERQAQFDALPEHLQTMISSFVDGVNAYIAVAEENPAARPAEYFAPPLNAVGMEEWDIDKAMAVMQFYIRRFGEAGGRELARFLELQDEGVEWFNENRPINDPTAPTTLPGEPPAARSAYAYANASPTIRSEAAAAAVAQREVVEAALKASGVPEKFGSYAALISGDLSVSGRAMLLGAPQMGLPQVTNPGALNRNVTWESELIVGSVSDPTLHIAGMTVVGIPGVIIGRTKDIAWTLTSGNKDNTDTYVYEVNELGQYEFNGETRSLEVEEGTVSVLNENPVPFTRARVVIDDEDQRPVYTQDAAAGQVFAYRYAFWGRELDMAVALYDVWKADEVDEVEMAIAQFPVSFNFFLLHRDQTIGFYHVGRYPDRPDNVDPRLPAEGDGSQEWEGFLSFSEHPQGTNPAQGYYVNWNNKPAAWWDQGDNMPWSPAPGAVAGPRSYDGVLLLEAYLTANTPLAFDEMKGLHQVVVENPTYPEYPGSYQQIILFGEEGSLAENLVPPGQSAFFGLNAQFQVVPSPHTDDQWELYQTYEMKPFTFAGEQQVSAEPGSLPIAVPVLEAYPNPAAGAAATVRFGVPEGGAVRLELFDLLGRSVAVLVDEDMAPGEARTTLDVSGLSSGVYLLRLQGEGTSLTRKLSVVR